MPDISEDSAIFGIITAFPGCSPDFMLGFEAGMVWGQLWSAKNPIKIIIEKANLAGITKLAEHLECRIKVEDHQESDSLVLTLTKTKPERPPDEFEVAQRLLTSRLRRAILKPILGVCLRVRCGPRLVGE
jgi:hypothetical protein